MKGAAPVVALLTVFGVSVSCSRPPLLVGALEVTATPIVARFEQPVPAGEPEWELCFEFDLPRDSHRADGIQAVLHALGEGQAVLVFPEGERTYTGEFQSLKPGISLLIKRVRCPIVPVGIAGAFAAWSRHVKLPTFSPLLLQPGPSTIAVVVGEPIDPARYAGMEREEMLADLHRSMAAEQVEAERLRRK